MNEWLKEDCTNNTRNYLKLFGSDALQFAIPTIFKTNHNVQTIEEYAKLQNDPVFLHKLNRICRSCNVIVHEL